MRGAVRGDEGYAAAIGAVNEAITVMAVEDNDLCDYIRKLNRCGGIHMYTCFNRSEQRASSHHAQLRSQQFIALGVT